MDGLSSKAHKTSRWDRRARRLTGSLPVPAAAGGPAGPAVRSYPGGRKNAPPTALLPSGLRPAAQHPGGGVPRRPPARGAGPARGRGRSRPPSPPLCSQPPAEWKLARRGPPWQPRRQRSRLRPGGCKAPCRRAARCRGYPSGPAHSGRREGGPRGSGAGRGAFLRCPAPGCPSQARQRSGLGRRPEERPLRPAPGAPACSGLWQAEAAPHGQESHGGACACVAAREGQRLDTRAWPCSPPSCQPLPQPQPLALLLNRCLPLSSSDPCSTPGQLAQPWPHMLALYQTHTIFPIN